MLNNKKFFVVCGFFVIISIAIVGCGGGGGGGIVPTPTNTPVPTSFIDGYIYKPSDGSDNLTYSKSQTPPSGYQPAEGAVITVQSATASSFSKDITTTQAQEDITDSNGYFHIDIVEIGEYEVIVQMQGFSTIKFRLVAAPLDTPTQDATIQLYPDEAIIEQGLGKQFVCGGKDGAGMPFIPRNISWGVEGEIGTIDNNGFFTATSVGTGKIIATASQLKAYSNVRVVEGRGNLEGIVLNRFEEPLPDVTLTITGIDKIAITNADGAYQFKDLPANVNLTVNVLKDDKIIGVATDVKINPAQTTNLNIKVEYPPITPTPTFTLTPTFTPTQPPTSTPTFTPTSLPPTYTPTSTPSPTNTPTPTPTKQAGTLKWSYPTTSGIYSSPAIGSDGTIYVGSNDHNLYAINPDGSLWWRYTTGDGVESSPAIGSDGTIYVGSNDYNLYAISGNGSLKWSYHTNAWIHSSPAIGSDGTIYVGSMDNNLYAIQDNGSNYIVKWSYTTGNSVRSSPAIGSDGTIYVGSDDHKLYAIQDNGNSCSVKWSCPTGDQVRSSPAIGSDGTIYVGSWDRNIYAINPSNGSLNWSYPTGGAVYSSPAIGSDGTIYVGSNDNKLYAINSNGQLKWSYYTYSWIHSSPAIGSDGTIYVGSCDGKLYAINSSDRTLKWSYNTGNSIYSSPAIGSDGTVYVGSSYLYAIYGESSLDTSAPWPMFHNDLLHTGRK